MYIATNIMNNHRYLSSMATINSLSHNPRRRSSAYPSSLAWSYTHPGLTFSSDSTCRLHHWALSFPSYCPSGWRVIFSPELSRISYFNLVWGYTSAIILSFHFHSWGWQVGCICYFDWCFGAREPPRHSSAPAGFAFFWPWTCPWYDCAPSFADDNRTLCPTIPALLFWAERPPSGCASSAIDGSTTNLVGSSVAAWRRWVSNPDRVGKATL